MEIAYPCLGTLLVEVINIAKNRRVRQWGISKAVSRFLFFIREYGIIAILMTIDMNGRYRS